MGSSRLGAWRHRASLVKELPLEYVVELNRLVQLQMEGSVG